MKVSDYIMEQNINTTSCDDIEIARCFAEMEVLGALVDCYAKQAMIMEYYKGDDITEFSIFQEATDVSGDSYTSYEDSPAKKNIFKRAIYAFLKAFKAIGEMFLKIIGRESFAHMAQRVKKTAKTGGTSTIAGDPDNTYYHFSENLGFQIDSFTSDYYKLSETANTFIDYLKNDVSDKQKYRKLRDDVINLSRPYNHEKGEEFSHKTYFTPEEMYDFLMDLDKAKIDTSVKKMLKNINSVSRKDFKNTDNGDLMKEVKDTAKTIIEKFNIANKNLRDMMNTIIKNANKTYSLDKKNVNKLYQDNKKANKKTNKESGIYGSGDEPITQFTFGGSD